MNIRPRCREWLPLATQQLRLRNLIRIQGLNIECSTTNDADEALIYYTLHSSEDSEPFYTSEALPRRHLQQKWAEIACPDILKSNANCVCVKVWARFEYTATHDRQKVYMAQSHLCRETSALAAQLSHTTLTPSKLPRPPDKLLFTWGVYFSGLVPVSQQTDMQYHANCLLFQMNGDYFASPEHITAKNVREQLSLNYQRHSASVPKTNNANNDAFSINSPQVSRSSSPATLDLQRDLLRMLKTRYVQLQCARHDVRRSYDLQKLLKIQELQRLHLQKLRESLELVAEIKQLSVRCITPEQLLRKKRTTSLTTSAASNALQHHSMGRALSVLLAEQQQVEPRTLLRVQQLQQQLETLHCKQRLLLDESDTYAKRNAQLRQHHSQLIEERERLQTWLCEQRKELESETAELTQITQSKASQLQMRQRIVQHVERRMSALCMELREIYPISRNQQGVHTICGVPFLNMDAYVNDAKYASIVSAQNISPLALSASLGYVAHLVQMIAVVINRPLRNPVIHEGSRSRIMDIIKDIPYATRDYPLYSRSTIPSKPVKYAIYLLNQNIAQLCFDITGIRCDLRATIENILHIFTTLASIEENHYENRFNATHTQPDNRLVLLQHSNGDAVDSATANAVANSVNSSRYFSNNISGDSISKSHSSIDMNHVPVPPAATVAIINNAHEMPNTQAVPIPVVNSATQQRVSRSVGSYSDCDEHDFERHVNRKQHCYSNSESNITTFQRDHI